MSRKKITLVGAYPPPSGGVSVHIQRLAALLEERYEVEVLDLFSRTSEVLVDEGVKVVRPGGSSLARLRKGLAHLRTCSADVIHFHVSTMRNFCFVGHSLLLASRRARVRLLTMHGGGLEARLDESGPTLRAVFGDLIHRFDFAILVSEEQERVFARFGHPPAKRCILPAFLPPAVPRQSHTVDLLLAGLERPGRKLALICGYAVELYGFHCLVEAYEHNAKLGEVLTPLFVSYGIPDPAYMSSLAKRIEKVGGHLVNELDQRDFSALLSRIDVFIRLTDRDGDSIAVREAATLGKQVVASNIAPRPLGTMLVSRDEPSEIAEALEAVVSDPRLGIPEDALAGASERYLVLYESLFKNQNN